MSTAARMRMAAAGRSGDAFFVAERAHQVTVGGSGTTEVVTLLSTPNAGNTLVLIHGCRDTSTAGISVADSRGNTWTVDVGPAATSNNLVLIASTRQNTAQLLAGDTVTITFGTAPTNRLTLIEEFKGLATSSYVDKTATNGSSTAVSPSVSGTTAATTAASEVAIAAFCVSNGSSTAASYNAAGTTGTYTAFPSNSLQSGGTNQKYLMACRQVLTATGTQAAAATPPGVATYEGCIVTYKAA